jgi:hypothetical protein
MLYDYLCLYLMLDANLDLTAHAQALALLQRTSSTLATPGSLDHRAAPLLHCCDLPPPLP